MMGKTRPRTRHPIAFEQPFNPWRDLFDYARATITGRFVNGEFLLRHVAKFAQALFLQELKSLASLGRIAPYAPHYIASTRLRRRRQFRARTHTRPRNPDEHLSDIEAGGGNVFDNGFPPV
jgi:hypothetical protein